MNAAFLLPWYSPFGYWSGYSSGSPGSAALGLPTLALTVCAFAEITSVAALDGVKGAVRVLRLLYLVLFSIVALALILRSNHGYRSLIIPGGTDALIWMKPGLAWGIVVAVAIAAILAGLGLVASGFTWDLDVPRIVVIGLRYVLVFLALVSLLQAAFASLYPIVKVKL